jgi:hypothetical protein
LHLFAENLDDFQCPVFKMIFAANRSSTPVFL